MKRIVTAVMLFFVLCCASTVLALPVDKVEVGDGLAFLKYHKDQVLVTAFGDGWEQYGFDDVNWGSFSKTGKDDYSITGLSGMDLDDFIPHFIPLEIKLDGGWGTIEAFDATYILEICGNLKFGLSAATVVAIDEHNIAPAPVPEPTTSLLFGVGVAGLGLMTRKKKTT